MMMPTYREMIEDVCAWRLAGFSSTVCGRYQDAAERIKRLEGELTVVKAREPEAWFFECWTRGKHVQFASVDKDDHSWWPVDQWITVHRTPLCLNGEKECLYDARAQAGGE